jgi:hypothetical protein
MTTTVHFDKPLTQLSLDDAADWIAWFIQHGIEGYEQIFVPSELVWNPRSKTLKVQYQQHDEQNMPYTLTTKVKIPGGLQPFPGGYRIEEAG